MWVCGVELINYVTWECRRPNWNIKYRYTYIEIEGEIEYNYWLELIYFEKVGSSHSYIICKYHSKVFGGNYVYVKSRELIAHTNNKFDYYY